MQAALLALWLYSAAGADPSARLAPDTVAVCPDEFQAALAPWLEYRRQEGHTVWVVSAAGSEDDIRARIRLANAGRHLRFILLVGGANPRLATDPDVRRRSVPTHLAEAKVDVRFGSEPQIATDAWYADLDDDGVPDVAIGRLTVESPSELAAVVKKILAYEQGTDFRRWRSRINFVAGLGGFGPLTDAVLETSARQLIAQKIPAGYDATLTLASWQSPFCPDPRQFHAATLDRLNEGCLFWVYIGHGQRTGLDQLHLPNGNLPILDCRDMAQLHCQAGSPIAVLLACYTGAFDSPQRCLADEMLRADGAPAAIICGSRVTMPYGMTVLGSELLDECFQRHCPTLGEALLAAKRASVAQSGTAPSRRLMLDTLAQLMSPAGSDLAAERAEHLQLINLIGDPLLRLHYPRDVALDVPRSADAAGHLTVTGRCPVDGPCTVELIVRRDRLTFQPPTRTTYDPSATALAAYQPVYELANDPRLAAIQTTVERGRFQAELNIPAGVTGPCQVRAFVAGSSDWALGSTNIDVHSPNAESAAAADHGRAAGGDSSSASSTATYGKLR